MVWSTYIHVHVRTCNFPVLEHNNNTRNKLAGMWSLGDYEYYRQASTCTCTLISTSYFHNVQVIGIAIWDYLTLFLAPFRTCTMYLYMYMYL